MSKQSLVKIRFGFSTYLVTTSKLLIVLLPVSLMTLQGCTVLAIADAVGSVAVGTVGLAADAAIGTVRLGGKAIGAVAGAVILGSSDEKK